MASDLFDLLESSRHCLIETALRLRWLESQFEIRVVHHAAHDLLQELPLALDLRFAFAPWPHLSVPCLFLLELIEQIADVLVDLAQCCVEMIVQISMYETGEREHKRADSDIRLNFAPVANLDKLVTELVLDHLSGVSVSAVR